EQATPSGSRRGSGTPLGNRAAGLMVDCLESVVCSAVVCGAASPSSKRAPCRGRCRSAIPAIPLLRPRPWLAHPWRLVALTALADLGGRIRPRPATDSQEAHPLG